MDACPPVLIWSPAAAVLARAIEAGGGSPVIVADAAAAIGDAAILLVDARIDAAGAAAMLASSIPAFVRLALVDANDDAVQMRLVAAGATQIAVIGDAGEGLAPALRLAFRAAARTERRASAVAEPSVLDRWIDRRLAAGEAVAVVHVAMVRLDLVNAAHGRETATALVAAAERRIRAQVAAAAEEEGMVARLDGSAFTAAFAGPAEQAIVAAARIEEALARPFGLGATRAVLGTRIGLAGSRPDETAAALRARAAAGVMDATAPATADPLAVEVHLALARGEVAILFQPQADADGRITGVEALARWQHPERGCLGAESLLTAAERAGIGVALSEHIQRRILDEVAAWPAVLGGLRVALNLTAADLRRPGFVDTLLAHVDASGVARERLTLEVTETELMTDLDSAAAVLASLQQAGCRTAIDDFGTGYSSLAYLAALPIDYLKLDRVLAREVIGPHRGQMVVRGAIDLARSLGIAVVAEGVETKEQRAALVAAGCALYQGFLLAPPLTGGELVTMLANR